MRLITLPEPLRDRLGPEAAQALVDLLSRTHQETRDDVILLADERLGRRLAELDARWERRFSALETRLEHRHTGLIRWMVLLWAAEIGALLALLKL